MSEILLYEGLSPVQPPAGTVLLYAKVDGRFYFMADDGVEHQMRPVGAGTGDLNSDGSVPLIADWDAGAFRITARQLESSVVPGTSPLVIASTTLVANLNAEYLDGNLASAFAQAGGALAAARREWTESTK